MTLRFVRGALHLDRGRAARQGNLRDGKSPLPAEAVVESHADLVFAPFALVQADASRNKPDSAGFYIWVFEIS
jgi:hypothetical protein